MKTKVCKKAGCGRAAEPGKDYCKQHISLQGQQRKIFNQRGKSGQYHSMYESQEWRKRRAQFLKKYQRCFVCGAPATIADHIIPHRGDWKLFWDTANWQPLCKHCHDAHKQRQEHGGYLGGCGTDGMPADPMHPWNTMEVK